MSNSSIKDYLERNPFLPISECVFDILYHRIISFNYAPEEKIVISQISDEFDVGRSPVQSALQMLEEIGLVYSKKNKGFYVSPFNPTDYNYYYAFRGALEVAAIRKAAEHITDSQLYKLNIHRKALNEAYQNFDVKKIVVEEGNFHNLIIKLSYNPYIINAYDNLQPLLQRYRFFSAFGRDSHPLWIQQHNYIFSSLQLRDPDCCAAAMQKHMSFPVSKDSSIISHLKNYRDNS